MSSITYQHEYGETSHRNDRFGGQPRWIERVIREYELGHFGPKHNCTHNCDCKSCSKLCWFARPVCTCKLGNIWGKYLTLDEAMRRKWILCRCEPLLPPWTGQICPCLLLLPTKESSLVTLTPPELPTPEVATAWEATLESSWFCDLKDVDRSSS